MTKPCQMFIQPHQAQCKAFEKSLNKFPDADQQFHISKTNACFCARVVEIGGKLFIHDLVQTSVIKYEYEIKKRKHTKTYDTNPKQIQTSCSQLTQLKWLTLTLPRLPGWSVSSGLRMTDPRYIDLCLKTSRGRKRQTMSRLKSPQILG